MQTDATFETTLGALARPSGLARLQAHLEESGKPSTPDALSALGSFVQHTVEKNPELDNLELYITNAPFGHGGSAFYPKKRKIVTNDVTHLPYLAHELGHAKGLHPHSTGVSMLDFSRDLGTVAGILGVGALSIALGARKLPRLVGDVGKLKKLFGLGALTSAGIAAPTLYEEARASLDAVENLPNKAEAVRALVGPYMHYVGSAAIPPAMFLAARHLLK